MSFSCVSFKVLKIFVYPSILLGLFSCSESNKQNEIKIPSKPNSIDTTDRQQHIAVLKGTGKGFEVLTEIEMTQIDILLKGAVRKYNSRLAYSHKMDTINISYYKRQYVLLQEKNGDKLIYVNCFCSNSDNPNWKTEEVIVKDGGKCYFNLTINLSRGTYDILSVNGLA